MASAGGAIVLHGRLFTLDFRPGTVCRITLVRLVQEERQRDTDKGEKSAIKRDRRGGSLVKNRIV